MVQPSMKAERPLKALRVDDQHTMSTEAEVWITFLQGSEQAVATLYHRYANKLYNYGRQLTKNEDIILDAVQDVFLTLIRTRSKLSIATSVKFYLYSSFRRSLLRQLKRSHKFVLQQAIDDESFQISIDADYLSVNTSYTSDQKKIIENFCNKLPLRQREALVLHYFEDLNYNEIAQTMKLSTTKSARTMVYRALDSLTKLLATWKEELTIVTLLFLVH